MWRELLSKPASRLEIGRHDTYAFMRSITLIAEVTGCDVDSDGAIEIGRRVRSEERLRFCFVFFFFTENDGKQGNDRCYDKLLKNKLKWEKRVGLTKYQLDC